MLDPRAVATLGIGYGAGLVARIGLWAEEIISVGGTPGRNKKRRPGMIYNPLPIIEPARGRVEEAEALLFCDAL